MPRQRDESKVEAIQQAAMKLVVKTGFTGLKMAQVAKEAGVATGTLYNYFKDKEELINQAYVVTKQEMANVILSAENQPDNFYQSFRNMWFAYTRYCMKEPAKMLFVEQFLHSGILQEETISKGECFFEPMNQFLAAAQQQGLIRQAENKVITAQLMGPIHELVKVGLEKGIQWLEQQLETAFDMAWTSLRK